MRDTLVRTRGLRHGLIVGLSLLLLAPLGGRAEEVAFVPASATISDWDARSGNGAVEATRASRGAAPVAVDITSFVPSDVRWAPDEALAPAPDVPRFIQIAQRTLEDSDPGGSPQEALLAILSAYDSRDEQSGYGAVEATGAAWAISTAASVDLRDARIANPLLVDYSPPSVSIRPLCGLP